jgi:N-acyl-phosphatidylethanolamine-hydrolysing phospholipase D
VQDFRYTIPQDMSEDTLFRFTYVPAQHNSRKGAFGQGTTLWCRWVLLSKYKAKTSHIKRKGAIYHAGDTGYRRISKSTPICPIFKEIGQKLGPFDLSFILIWRGGSLGFISYLGLKLLHNNIPSALHSTPADAINIHNDVLSRNTVAVHFRTFVRVY